MHKVQYERSVEVESFVFSVILQNEQLFYFHHTAFCVFEHWLKYQTSILHYY